MIFVVAILETMWDWRSMTSGAGYQEAVPFFRINPDNYSGKRLYRLVGDNHLIVTNACRMLAQNPKQHGKGDPVWLQGNLDRIEKEIKPIDVLLVCGKVAQATFSACALKPEKARVLHMPHPAARTYWTREKIEETARLVQDGTQRQQQ